MEEAARCDEAGGELTRSGSRRLPGARALQPALVDDQFQTWLAHMDDALDAFAAGLPADLRQKLDGSVISLDALEAWLLSRYPGIAQAKAPAESGTLGGAARYVGEVLRQVTGSQWAIERGDPKFVYHGVPILRGGQLGRLAECPLSLVTAALDRRTGRYLSKVVGAMV